MPSMDPKTETEIQEERMRGAQCEEPGVRVLLWRQRSEHAAQCRLDDLR
jgi:hypothetical protein